MRRYDVEISTEKFSTHTVFINRIPNRSLGFTISSKRGNIYIKKVDTEPAISSGLKVHDKIISVNQRQIAGLDHVEIVGLMITSPSTLVLTVERRISPSDLEKADLETAINNSLLNDVSIERL
uniref:PDZ domain-containing protein n=1 Tax=Acrobeloides nanus TaxID=290746 RepID=A0A914EKK7_9BILA